MGNINKFRPLNGRNPTGRNGPSFLVCAMFIGLCILSVSYYNLSSQYNKLYDSMTEVMKQEKLLEAHLEKKTNEQMNEKLKEQKNKESLEETKQMLENKTKKITELVNLNAKTKEDLTKKTQDLTDAQVKIKELETLKSQLNEEINKQKEQIDELNKKLFKEPVKNQADINLQDNKSSLDPKRKIVDNSQPLNQPAENKDGDLRPLERSKDTKAKDDYKKQPKNDNLKRDPVVSLLNNKDKSNNQSS